MTEKELSIIHDILMHYEVDKATYDLGVTKAEYNVLNKHLKGYVTAKKSQWKERPVLISRNPKVKISSEIEALLYKDLYYSHVKHLDDMYDLTAEFAKKMGVL